MQRRLVIPDNGLEHGHVSVPSDHAPRLEVMFSAYALYVFVEGEPDSYLMAANPVEIRP